MGFWGKLNFDYLYLTTLSTEKLVLLVNCMDREDIIEWLSWNDPNGVYQDTQSINELGNVMSRMEGIEILLRQVEENSVL